GWRSWRDRHRSWRWRHHHVEPIAKSELDLAFVQIMLRYEKAARGGRKWGVLIERNEGVRIGERIVRDMAEIRIAVFRPHRPIVGDRIFDAAASSEARAGDRDGIIGAGKASEESGRIVVTGVVAGYGDAAGAVEQDGAP